MGLCRLASTTAVLKNSLHFLNFHTMCRSCFLPCAEAGINFSEPCAEPLLHRVPAHSKFDFPLGVPRALLPCASPSLPHFVPFSPPCAAPFPPTLANLLAVCQVSHGTVCRCISKGI